MEVNNHKIKCTRCEKKLDGIPESQTNNPYKYRTLDSSISILCKKCEDGWSIIYTLEVKPLTDRMNYKDSKKIWDKYFSKFLNEIDRMS